jgi:hypothetical protein
MEQPSKLDQLRALNDRVLAEIVCQDQRCPDFVITSWQVDRLSDKGIVNPDGLFRFSGTGYDAANREYERHWTVVLKNMKSPEEEGDITNIWFWKRELLAVKSGLLDDLPAGGVKAPRFYGTTEQNGSAWIWMEYIQENDPPRWPLQRFPTAARFLGKLNGAYLCGRPLPNYVWLSRDQGISWVKDMDPDGTWDHPVVQQIVSAVNRPRLQRLLADQERFFQVYRTLPQVFSHCDASRRNQLFRVNAEGVEEMVSIDWAWCGIAPIGWDLAMLLVDSTLLFELEPKELPGVEAAAFPAYLEGLRSSGWQGDSGLLRLGYCVSATLFPLMIMPRGAIMWSGDDMQSFALQTFGCRFDEVALGWRELVEHLLDLGEEALSLMNEMPQEPVTI